MPHFKFERAFAGIVCGVDEVGRGPLAGRLWRGGHPAAKAAPDAGARCRRFQETGIAERSGWMSRFAARHGRVGEASVAEIDSINILQAAFLAMRRALAS